MVIAIIQARLTSTRFPRKVLAKIKGKTILQWVIDGVNKAKLVDIVIVASPHYIPFTGAKRYIHYDEDEGNVIDRYYKCALQYPHTDNIIVRITADCPLIDHTIIDYAIAYYKKHKHPYVIFAPISGKDVEVFGFKTLKQAWLFATDSYDREHVTPYMQRLAKLSVDTKDELVRVKKHMSAKVTTKCKHIIEYIPRPPHCVLCGKEMK